ncbi:MAG TPA: GFA family protein [Candidatus Acidoferrum sp.]|nr:GFA family protein [Candidatus Acidoferrum sp.]
MSDPAPIEGRCLCGAVEFELEAPTDFLGICHCQSCRLSHGAPFVAWTSVPLDRFSFRAGEERVRWYRSSRWIRWGFCETCGSPLLYRADEEGHPEAPKVDRMYVSAGSLVTPLDREVEAHHSYEEKVLWYTPHDLVPRHLAKGSEPLDD